MLCGARIYVRCPGEALVCEPFYEACLIQPLHITQPHFGGYAVSRYIPSGAQCYLGQSRSECGIKGCLFFH
jgi:hypothetical protein